MAKDDGTSDEEMEQLSNKENVRYSEPRTVVRREGFRVWLETVTFDSGYVEQFCGKLMSINNVLE